MPLRDWTCQQSCSYWKSTHGAQRFTQSKDDDYASLDIE